jgi:hypothetical protein
VCNGDGGAVGGGGGVVAVVGVLLVVLVVVGRACGELAVVLAESVQSAWDCRRG